MPLRFSPSAASELRQTIREANGVEVFAIGDVEAGTVTAITVTCRGQHDRVTALLDRPRTGQVVIHNHPSGHLDPSDPDMVLAGYYGDLGIGFVIVNSDVSQDRWVIEPHAPKIHPVEESAVEHFFHTTLPKIIPDFEPRPGQIDMALRVAHSLSTESTLVVEAGTGTGKSLAYLVPAALWAKANDAKVVISTHTKALQGQLVSLDLPVLMRAGLDIRTALLQGRNNYVCKRRLGLAIEEDRELPQEERHELDLLMNWEQTTTSGSRSDIPLSLDPMLWERIESDGDLTLRTRCPHYASCHFYTARRNAAGAHLVIVNHALLLADLSVRDTGAKAGILPNYSRLILDEAHHIEDAATGAIAERLTLRGIERALSPLFSRRGRPGVLERLVVRHRENNSPLENVARECLEDAAPIAASFAASLKSTAMESLLALADDVIPMEGTPVRIDVAFEQTDLWNDRITPNIEELANSLESAAGALDPISSLFTDLTLTELDSQPLLELNRCKSRLAGYAAVARSFLQEAEGTCRWLERMSIRDRTATLNLAPIDIGLVLRRILWEKIPGTSATSATLTVGGRFEFWSRRVGLPESETAIFPSPFDHSTQALLALPRDIPEPESPDFLEISSQRIIDAVKLADGGTFVLCTSYAAVRHYASALRAVLPPQQPVLFQEAGTSRNQLLERFRDNRRAVLVGTDSFWEGVSVKGEGLRLVIIPRLPFRVPTEPLRLCRIERIVARGGDAFRSYALPEATIKLKQGYGRLIRHRGDRGVVLLLDRRIHDRSYGALILRSLPPARRISAPWQRVREEIKAFFAGVAPENL